MAMIGSNEFRDSSLTFKYWIFMNHRLIKLTPKSALVICSALVVAACQTTPDTVAIKRTFDSGQNRIPDIALKEGEFRALTEIREYPETWKTRVSTTKLKPGIRIPAVIYLHGCAGNTGGLYWGIKFNQLGYAFFAPDSLARPRKSLCGSGRSSMIAKRIPMRIEELQYTFLQLRGLDWIDHNRIILMGSSEGAQAASAYRGDEFAAVILEGTDCKFVGGSPNTPSGVPVLNIVGSKDNGGGGFGCGIRRNIGGSKKVIIEGGYHKLGNHPEAWRILEQFLSDCCTNQ
jgi:hypothetical protein